MSDYKGIQVPEPMLQAARAPEKVEGTFDGGVVFNKSPQDIELNQTPNSDIVRVERGALRQDYDVVTVGTDATTKLLALGEYRYVDSSLTVFDKLFRLYLSSLSAATVEIDTWPGDDETWSSVITTGGSDSLTLDRRLASWRAYFNEIYFATGGDICRWVQTASLTAQVAEFDTNNSLTAEGDTEDVTIVPAAAYNSTYNVHYKIGITGPSESGAQLVFQILDNDDAVVGTMTYELPVSSDTSRDMEYAHEVKAVNAVIETGETLTLKLLTITQSTVTRTIVMYEGANDEWFGIKAQEREPSDDSYTFTYSLTGTGPGSATATFYSNPGGTGYVSRGTATVSYPGVNYTKTITADGMGNLDLFKIVLSNITTTCSISNASVTWEEPFEVDAHGFISTAGEDVESGVTYDVESGTANTLIDVPKSLTSITTGTATGTQTSLTLVDTGASWSSYAGKWVTITAGTGIGQIRKIASNTGTVLTVSLAWSTNPVTEDSEYDIGTATALEGRYLGVFANRIVVLQEGGDPQKITWSLNGYPDSFSGDGAGETILVGKSDPVDELMGLEDVGSGVGALFRRRSIMKVNATGSTDPALAFYDWIGEIGTESPFSITKVPGGVMFLGHDRMVYYLTNSAIVPVGQPIQESFTKSIGNLESVEGEYDAINQDYMMAVPTTEGDNTAVSWFFDMDRFLREGVRVWQRHSRTMNRLTTWGDGGIYFSDGTASPQVYKFDRTAVEDGAYWESPMLNRKDRDAEYTLSLVTLRFETNGVTPVLVIEGSGDGGITWSVGNDVTTTLTNTQGAVKRASQKLNVTGSDLRFRVKFDDTGKVLLRGWKAELIERGGLGDDI